MPAVAKLPRISVLSFKSLGELWSIIKFWGGLEPPQVCGRNSVVECQLPKLNVVGSSPIVRFGETGKKGFATP